MVEQIKSFFTALRFLTVFPDSLSFPQKRESINSKSNAQELGKSAAYFPIVGFIIGAVLYIFNLLLDLTSISLQIKAVLIILLLTVVTGALHLDGLADTADAAASGWDRQKSLKMMKNGTVGAFGVIALFFTLALKIFLIQSILSSDKTIAALLIFPVLGRWAMVYSMAYQPYARKTNGLGKIFTDNCTTKEFLIASAVTLLILVGLPGAYGLLIILSVLIFASLANAFFRRKFGGITGDTLGALCELTEVLTLFLLL